jgi:beta-1,2-mannobiose phosphorylase / 1,2-beta-oligomannan phosphorylase
VVLDVLHRLFRQGPCADRTGRSNDGITDWERRPANPIVRPGKARWDEGAVYKPFAIFDGKRWLPWYNGRRGGVEQIGAATHDGEDLGF